MRSRTFTTSVILFVAVPMLLPLLAPAYVLTPIIYIGLSALVGVGLVFLGGLAAMMSFGQASFCGVGAYATAVLTTSFGWPSLAGLAAGLIATFVIAGFIGAVTARLSSHYLVLGTLAWSIGFYYLFANIDGLGGFNGITGLESISVGRFSFDTPQRFFVLVWACVALALWASHNIIYSRVGRAIRAIPEPVMAGSMGIPVAMLKVQIFIYAALLASLSGWLQAHYLKVVTPGSFGINASLDYVFMAVIGGVGQLGGAVLGAGIVEIIGDLLRDWLPMVAGQAGSYESIVFGFILLILLRNAPAGLMPLLGRILPRADPVVAPSVADPLPSRAESLQAVLQVASVRKRFGGLVAVDDVSFSLRAGEVLALIGPNGAGKSTLFDLLTGVRAPDRGTITFCGQRIDRREAMTVAAAGISRSFQHVLLRPEMSVLENVAIGAHLRGRNGFFRAAFRLNRVEEGRLLFEAQRQLDRTGLGELARQPVRNLSLGQQRIVEIARALASDPVLLLLDEPAAGLRFAEKEKLAALLAELRAQGVGILIVEHDMAFVMKLADRVIVIDFGQKIAEGLPEEVTSNKRVIEAYLGVDLELPPDARNGREPVAMT